MSYVGKMLFHSLHYRYFAHLHSESLHKGDGVAVGAPRCAESGHSDAQNTFSVKAEAVESPHRHEKSQGRIQSARYAYHKATGARGIEPLA